MAKVELYSVKEGKLVDYELSVDGSGEIVATYKDSNLKFPAGLSKKELQSAFKAHNQANDGKVAKDESKPDEDEVRQAESQKLLDSL